MKRPAPWRIRQLAETVPAYPFGAETTETFKTVVVGWVIEQLMLVTITADHTEGEYMVVDYYPSGEAAIAAFAEYGSLAI